MKRMLSMLLVCAMLMGMFGIVPVAAEEDASGYRKGDISFFSTFGDFEGTNTVPPGFVNIQGGARLGGIDSMIYNEGGRASTAARLAGDKQPVIPFNTNFLDGYMHISFDYLQTNENAGTTTDRMLSVLFSKKPNGTAGSMSGDNPRVYYDVLTDEYSDGKTALENCNEYDYTKLIPDHAMNLFEGGSKEAGYARTLYTTTNKKVVGISDAEGTPADNYSTAEDKWYKVDMFFDRDDNTYKVYVDGVLQEYQYLADKSGKGTGDLLGRPFGSEGNRAMQALVFRCDHLRDYSGGQVDGKRADGYVYLDNVYVSQYYANDSTKDTLKMELDTMGSEKISGGSVINIGFSEWLASAPTDADIEIKDSNGNSFTDFTVASTGAQATITINENASFSDGTYTISVKDNINGKTSGSTVSNTVQIETVKSTPASSTNYYWANEDFEDFETGVVLPNWYYGFNNLDVDDDKQYNRYWMPEATGFESEVRSATGADGKSTAIELIGGDGKINDNDLFYFFPRGVATGQFTAEFDIKHTNGAWAFGFVNYDDFTAARHRVTAGEVKSGGYATGNKLETGRTAARWQMSRRLGSSILLGMAPNNITDVGVSTDPFDAITVAEDRAKSPNLGLIVPNIPTYRNGRSYIGNLKTQKVDNSEDLMQISANNWSKIKIDVDDTSKNYTITVTPYNSDGTANTDAAKVTTWNDPEAGRYLQGIMGIRFSRDAMTAAEVTAGATQTGSVFIDNVKVYKTQTSYLDEDFDDYTKNAIGTTGANQLPSGWMSHDNNTRGGKDGIQFFYHAVNTTATGVSSNDGKPNDDGSTSKSMHLYYGAPSLYKTLDRPIPAGKPFVVEFDTYSTSASDPSAWAYNNESTWSFMQMGKEDTQQLPGFNYAGNLMSKDGKALVERHTYTAEGTDAITQLISDEIIATYTPFASSGETVPTVADTYARINGNSILDNVVFSRGYGSLNFEYSPTGRQSAKRGIKASMGHPVGIADVIGEWVNYKILCVPSATGTTYTITQTKADGTKTEKSFTNSRDWYTQDTYGIGFALPARSNQTSANAKNGLMGTRFDNVKVYAVNADNSESKSVETVEIEKIEASNESGTEVADMAAGAGVPVETKKIAITFSKPVAEAISRSLPTRDDSLPEVLPTFYTDKTAYDTAYEKWETDHATWETEHQAWEDGGEQGTEPKEPMPPVYKGVFTEYIEGNNYTDYTAILDTIKDVISVRKKGSQLDNGYTMALTNDNKTVEITFNTALVDGDVYTLGINENIAFEGNGYAKLEESFTKVYTVSSNFTETAEPTPDVPEEINFTKLNATVLRGTADIPVHKAGPLTEGEQMKLSITTENTGSDLVKALVGFAFYEDYADTDSKLLSLINTDVLEIAAGKEKGEITMNTGTTIPATIDVPVGASSFKMFSWSYPKMVPYVDLVEAAVE